MTREEAVRLAVELKRGMRHAGVLDLCEYVIEGHHRVIPRTISVPEACPICVRRRALKREAQKRFRDKRKRGLT